MGMSGLLHAPAALPQRNKPDTRWRGGWNDPTVWPDIFENPI